MPLVELGANSIVHNAVKWAVIVHIKSDTGNIAVTTASTGVYRAILYLEIVNMVSLMAI